MIDPENFQYHINDAKSAYGQQIQSENFPSNQADQDISLQVSSPFEKSITQDLSLSLIQSDQNPFSAKKSSLLYENLEKMNITNFMETKQLQLTQAFQEQVQEETKEKQQPLLQQKNQNKSKTRDKSIDPQLNTSPENTMILLMDIFLKVESCKQICKKFSECRSIQTFNEAASEIIQKEEDSSCLPVKAGTIVKSLKQLRDYLQNNLANHIYLERTLKNQKPPSATPSLSRNKSTENTPQSTNNSKTRNLQGTQPKENSLQRQNMTLKEKTKIPKHPKRNTSQNQVSTNVIQNEKSDSNKDPSDYAKVCAKRAAIERQKSQGSLTPRGQHKINMANSVNQSVQEVKQDKLKLQVEVGCGKAVMKQAVSKGYKNLKWEDEKKMQELRKKYQSSLSEMYQPQLDQNVRRVDSYIQEESVEESPFITQKHVSYSKYRQ